MHILIWRLTPIGGVAPLMLLISSFLLPNPLR